MPPRPPAKERGIEEALELVDADEVSAVVAAEPGEPRRARMYSGMCDSRSYCTIVARDIVCPTTGEVGDSAPRGPIRQYGKPRVPPDSLVGLVEVEAEAEAEAL